MLFPSLFAVLLLANVDSVPASIAISAVRPEAPAVEWILFDSANVLVDRGVTPSEMSTVLTGKPQTLCAMHAGVWLKVSLDVASRHTQIRGEGRCFRFGFVGGRVRLDGVLHPASAP